MRRLLAITMSLFLLVFCTACGAENNTEKGDDNSGVVTPSVDKDNSYVFTYEGVDLYVGDVFSAALLPQAESVYEVPSCAIEGTDNVYNYGTFELTAFNDGSKEVIYSIYITDANTPTIEGLYLGDNLTQMESAYGIEYERTDNQVVYAKGDSRLIFILQNDIVISIEFRMAI